MAAESAEPPEARRAPGGIGNVGLALSILEQVAVSGSGVSANAIASTLGIPRATMYRVINSLVQEEYLVRMPDLRGFALGRRVIELAHLVTVPVTSPRDRLRAELTELREQIGLPLHLARYRDWMVEIIDEDPNQAVSYPRRIANDPTSSALGQLLIANRFDRLREQHPQLSRTETMLVSASIATQGYALQSRRLTANRACIAVPVHAETEMVLGGLAVATTPDMIDEAIDRLPALMAAARRIAPELADAQ